MGRVDPRLRDRVRAAVAQAGAPMTHNRKDANEADLVRLWESAGGIWYAQDRTTGFDGVAVFRGRILLVEVKDGSKPPSAQALTPNERRQQARIEDQGVEYTIWRSVEDVVDALQG
jgi:hypothetical protein